MCNPSLAIMAVGTAISAYSTLQQGNAAAAQYEYQAEQQERAARNEASAAKVRADKIRRAAMQKQGEARANLAASGVDVDAGTSVEINKTIAKNAEEDALIEILNGEGSAATMRSQADNYRTAGSNAKTSATINAGSTLLSGGYQAYKGWKTAKGVNT